VNKDVRAAAATDRLTLTVGVMGSASGAFGDGSLAKMRALGRAVAERGCTLLTGACPGLPQAAVEGACEAGGLVVGISPGLSLYEHVTKYASPTEGFDVLIFTGSGLMGREIENIRSSDVVVIAGGRSGTLGEFAIAYDEGRLIGVLAGTGGVRCRVRLVAFGGRGRAAEPGVHTLPLARCQDFIRTRLRAYRDVLAGVHFSGPVLGLLALQEKLGQDADNREGVTRAR
jgi:uncharacterized protein (TIGR00725 family)